MRNENQMWQAQVRRGIRRMLLERGMSQAQLARLLDMPQPSLWNFISGKSPFRMPYAIAIAYVLGTSVDRLAQIGAIEIDTQEATHV